MSIQIQIRGGTTLEHTAFRGQSREITCDTDKNTIVVHDGQTLGGFPLAHEDLANVETTAITDKGIATTAADNFTPEGEDKLRQIVIGDPVGIIVCAPLSSIDGYLKCDGAEISRETYAYLFSKIGISFGDGDGETTFNIPDYRGCFLRGLGGNSAENFETLQGDAIRNVIGQVGAIGDTRDGTYMPSNPFYSEENYVYSGGTTGAQARKTKMDLSRSVPTAEENRPINKAVNFFIKY